MSDHQKPQVPRVVPGIPASDPQVDHPPKDGALAIDEAELLRVTLSSIGDGVITTDRQGKVATLNPVAQALSGWTQEDAIGRPLQEVFHIVNQHSRAEVENPALRALRNGIIVGLSNHTLLISKDGSEHNIDDSAAPIKNVKGDVAGAVLVFRDITERYAKDATLLESEMRYRRLFQAAKDGVLLLDAQTGRITDANAFMGGLVGMDAHELLGKELHEIGLFGDIAASKAAFEQLRQNHYIRYEHLPLQNQRGQTVEVEVVANVYQEGRTLVAQCNVRDISQRVAMEKKIQEQAAALAEEARRKDEFLAMLSHELRNPLAPIRAAVHLLRSHELSGTENIIQRQAHEIIERQVANLTKIISDLMEISRVVSGRIRLRPQTLDLNQIVRHAVETTTPLFVARKHEVVVHVAPGNIWTSADPTRLEEVFINLLNNAAKYTPDGGKIEVWCEHPRGTNHAMVRVRDNGVGIEAALLKGGRIFDLFTQADRSLNRSEGGLGIGLSLVHRLVHLHGGTIEAYSPPRTPSSASHANHEPRAGVGAEASMDGSEFIVRLPVVQAPTATPTKQPQEIDTPNSGRRVLIVDDNRDLVLMLSSSMRQKGYSVETALTGPDGLAVARQWKPDIVLLDIGLPGLDGYEVARRLRREPFDGHAGQRMRLIAITGYGRQSDIALALEAGFDGHLTKPVDFEDLDVMMSAPKE